MDYKMEAFVLLWFVSVFFLMFIAKTNSSNDTPMDFETRRLAFASIVLSGLGLIFIFIVGLYFFSEDGDQAKAAIEIFEAAKTIIPPIITLVLGYYFGQTQQETNQGDGNTNATPQNPSSSSGPSGE